MPTVTGKVKKINIKGYGQNSAQLLFAVKDQTLIVTAYPEYEPQVFSAMASLIVGAFYSGEKVTVNYKTIEGETSRATEIEVSKIAPS